MTAVSDCPGLMAGQYVSPQGVRGAWVVQYPFVEPGKAGRAIDIAPTRADLLDLVDAVARSEGWSGYTITFKVDLADPRAATRG